LFIFSRCCVQLKFESATAQEEDDTDEMVQSHRKGKERMMPRELNSGHMQSCGIPKQLLASGSVGRGRAMVQPAWMKHGIGIGGPLAAASPMAEDEKQSSDVTERVTSTVEEGAAVIARLKEEKRRRKEEGQRRRERRHGKSGRGERHKRRRHDEERHGHRRKHRLGDHCQHNEVAVCCRPSFHCGESHCCTSPSSL
jgi:hypothetical protein